MLTLTGRVLEIKDFSGDNYAFMLAIVLVGKSGTEGIKFNQHGEHRYKFPLPVEGDDISVEVSMQAYTDKRTKLPRVGLEAVRPIEVGKRAAA